MSEVESNTPKVESVPVTLPGRADSEVTSNLSGEKPPAAKTLSDYAKEIATLAAAVTAISFVFYAFGYIIVNLFYLSLGVRVFGLVNAIYLPAGVAFSAIALGPLLLLLAVQFWMLRKPWRPAWRIIALPLGLTTIYLVIVLVLLQLFIDPEVLAVSRLAQQGLVEGSIFYGRFLWWAALLALVSFCALSLTQDAVQGENGSEEPVVIVVVPLTFLVALFGLLALFSWSTYIYPFGSPSVGGGQTVDVSLILNPPDGMTADELGDALGLPMSGDTTRPVGLLYEDDATITVLTTQDLPLRIDKAFVLAVRYVPAFNLR